MGNVWGFEVRENWLQISSVQLGERNRETLIKSVP